MPKKWGLRIVVKVGGVPCCPEGQSRRQESNLPHLVNRRGVLSLNYVPSGGGTCTFKAI